MQAVNLHKEDDRHFVLSGELSFETVPLLDKLADERLVTKEHDVILCLKQITKVDTAGLAWLINERIALKKHDIHLAICNIPENIRKLSRLSNAEELLDVQEGEANGAD